VKPPKGTQAYSLGFVSIREEALSFPFAENFRATALRTSPELGRPEMGKQCWHIRKPHAGLQQRMIARTNEF
jgi:hypothetical protein